MTPKSVIRDSEVRNPASGVRRPASVERHRQHPDLRYRRSPKFVIRNP